MKSHQQFFAELKRRHVFRVAAVYGAVAFVLLQVAELLGQGLRLPDSFMPFITAVILLGFPLALILAWAFQLTPGGVQRTAAAAPGEIERLVAEPASKRWPSGLLALAGGVALLAGAWWVGTQTGPAGSGSVPTEARADSLRLALAEPADERPSIAVLPFADMSPESDQAYFSDGMTEEILNVLARIRELKVAARTSAFAFRGRDLDMRAIGDSLDVAYLIEGSVRKAGDRLRITAQLIDASDGTHIWSESYDRTMDDIFAIQSEIAGSIADRLRVPLGLDDGEHLVTPTTDLDAYDLYLAARTKIRERGAGLRDAVRLLEGAVARDSAWAPAWAALAEAHELRTWYPAAWDSPPTDADSFNATVLAHQSAAEQAAKRALDLDPNLVSARIALGSVYRERREWERAEREYLRALALDPDDPEAHQQYSEMLGDVGRIAEAVISAERAVRLDPAPIRHLNYGGLLWSDARSAEAEAQFRTGLMLDPDHNVPVLRGGWYLLQMWQGDVAEAVAFGYPDDQLIRVDSADHARAARALRAGDASLLPAAHRASGPFITMTWEAFGNRDRALAALEDMTRQYPYGNLGHLWFEPLDRLRDDPRFREVLRMVNIQDARLERTPREAVPEP